MEKTRLKVFKTLFYIFLFLGILIGSPEAQPPIQEKKDKPAGQATIRVGVSQIQVDVTVQNKDGNLIRGLQPEHFKVYEDKIQQKIINFSPVQASMTAVLLVEYSSYIVNNLSYRAGWEMLYEAWLASRLFVNDMRQEDWIALIAYDLNSEILVDFTQDPHEVNHAISKLRNPGFSESNFYDAVIDTLDRLEEVEGKVSIVLVTTGLDSFSKANLGKLLKRVKNTNVTIYAVGLGGNFLARNDFQIPGTVRLDFQQAEAILKAITKSTGGAAYFPRFTTGYPKIFKNISTLVRSRYSLSYISSNTQENKKFRKLRIKVEVDVDGNGKPDKLKVLHKEGYYPGNNK